MSQGGGGGGGFRLELPKVEDVMDSLSDFGSKIISNPQQGLNDYFKDIANVMSLGAYQMAEEGVGAITGRNGAREQMMKAEDRLAREESLRNKMMADERQTAQKRDEQASSAAGRGRTPGRSRSSGSGGGYSARGIAAQVNEPLSIERDFLGL